MKNFNKIIHTIKRIRLPRIPKPVRRKRSSVHRTIISISGSIIGIAIKRPITHQTLLQVGR